MIKEIGLYVHIPFCKQKCYYCDFVSFDRKDDIIYDYIQAMKKEIELVSKEYDNSLVNTIYFGGGTPSYIKANYINEILESIKNNFNIEKRAEITIEVNPGTVGKGKLDFYKKIGFNRLSIGLQSTDNKILKKIGRIHTFEDFLDTYNLARKVGFANINIDLMIGLPTQSIDGLIKELDKIIFLNPEHISIYSLIIEENTKIEQLILQKELILPEEDYEREMYWYVKRVLEKSGYKHYEISNFAKIGYESRHNTNCWNQEEYIGIGVAAHSYMDGKRYANVPNIEIYIHSMFFDENKNRELLEMQDKESKEREFMLLSLRKLDGGVSKKVFYEKFNKKIETRFNKEINKLIKMGLLEENGDSIKLTDKGIDLANIVWREFV